MRPHHVVFLQPGIGGGSNLLNRVKEIGVQHILTIGTIEAFNVGILGRFAWLDEIPEQLVVARPVGQHLGDKLGTIIAANRLRIAAVDSDLIENTDNPGGR